MRFVVNNPHGFYGKQSFFPFLIALMKFTAGMLTEFCNIFIIVQSSNIENTIKDFIAFGFICEIDDLVLQTVNLMDYNEVFDRSGISFHKKFMLKTFYQSFWECWEDKLMTIPQKLLNTLQLMTEIVLRKTYKIFYYYFFPLLTIVLVLFYGPQTSVVTPTSYLK